MRALTFDGSAFPLDSAVKFPATIAHNVIPMAGTIVDDGSLETDEEQKLRNESRKILEIPDLLVDATCVRVPVFTGHSLSITASFERPISPEEATALLGGRAGRRSLHDMPTPRLGRGQGPDLRRAASAEPRRWRTASRSFLSGDNLRKGAALNAVQIAEALLACASR